MSIGPHASRGLAFLVILLLLAWGLTDVRRRADLDPANPGSHRTDFTVYTEAGAAFFDGRDPYAVTNARGWHYLYPPLFAILVAPLHPLPPAWQGVAWFVLSLIMAGGCLFECRAILRSILEGSGELRSDWLKIRGWVVAGTGLAVVFPVLDMLQRGQVGLAVLWPLLAGLRLVLDAQEKWRPFLGGIFLALSTTIKVTPALPVCILLARLLWDAIRQERSRLEWQRFLHAGAGVAAGLVVFVLLVPAAAVGWTDNLKHLQTWQEQVAANEHRGPDHQFNAHSVRNQSLDNAVYRLGNWVDYTMAGGADDRHADQLARSGQGSPMDAPLAGNLVTAGRVLLLLLLLAVVWAYRPSVPALGQAAVFGLACAMTLPISPISWGHHFVILLPALLILPWALHVGGRPLAARISVASAAVLLLAHYASLELAGAIAGRLGLLGIGMTLWCAVASLSLLMEPAAGASPAASHPDGPSAEHRRS